MLQAALWVHAVKDVDWSHRTVQDLEKATHWLYSMLDPATGYTPNLGANDGALILPLSVAPFIDFRPTVQAAAQAFLGSQIPSGVWDEFALWLGLDISEKELLSEQNLSHRLRGRETWAYLRATDFRSRLGHMDQLHLDLWWRGLNVAQDTGTYLYNAEPPWDNPLVTSLVHNTVTVDGRNQMTRGGRFMTLDWFPAHLKAVLSNDETVLGQVVAYHEGYRSVRHERTVTVYTDERWEVKDKLISKKPHSYRLHWLLPNWEWEIRNREQGVEISLISQHGRIVLVLHIEPQLSNLHSLISVVRAGEVVYGTRAVQPFEGWASPTYGQKIPALSLALETRNVTSGIFLSEFIFPA